MEYSAKGKENDSQIRKAKGCVGVSSIESVKRILITGTRHLGKAGLISEFSGLLQLAVRQSGSQAGRQAELSGQSRKFNKLWKNIGKT